MEDGEIRVEIDLSDQATPVGAYGDYIRERLIQAGIPLTRIGTAPTRGTLSCHNIVDGEFAKSVYVWKP